MPRTALGRPVMALVVVASISAVAFSFVVAAYYLSTNPTNPGARSISQSITNSSSEAMPPSINSTTNPNNTISVSGLSLCSRNCIYPAPHSSALINITATVPISTLTVYVNNTYDGLVIQNPSTTTITYTAAAGQTCSVQLGGTGYSNATYTTVTKYYATCSVPANSTSCSAINTGSVNTLTKFAYVYKGSLPDKFIPAVQGAKYVFTFVATFQDGSTATVVASTIAS